MSVVYPPHLKDRFCSAGNHTTEVRVTFHTELGNLPLLGVEGNRPGLHHRASMWNNLGDPGADVRVWQEHAGE